MLVIEGAEGGANGADDIVLTSSRGVKSRAVDQALGSVVASALQSPAADAGEFSDSVAERLDDLLDDITDELDVSDVDDFFSELGR